MQDWWLDVVCGENHWDALLHTEDGQVLGIMPYYMPVPGHISMPPFTQFLGSFCLENKVGSGEERSFREKRLIHDALRALLPPYRSFLVQFSSLFTDWLPYYWSGYSQTTRYTYRIDLTIGFEEVCSGIRPDAMKKIRKGERDGLRYVSASVDDLLRLCRISMSRQEEKNFASGILRSLARAAIDRHAGEIVGCEDAEGNLLAAVFLVYDRNTAYTIASGQIREGKGRNAGSLALYHAISRSCQIKGLQVFDFEGSMLEGVEGFFRSFGGIQTPYFRLTKGRIGLMARFRRKWHTYRLLNKSK